MTYWSTNLQITDLHIYRLSNQSNARLRMEQCKKKNINDVALGIINGRVQSTAQVHANVNTNLQVRDQLGG